jgi:hypothetical protein
MAIPNLVPGLVTDAKRDKIIEAAKLQAGGGSAPLVYMPKLGALLTAAGAIASPTIAWQTMTIPYKRVKLLGLKCRVVYSLAGGSINNVFQMPCTLILNSFGNAALDDRSAAGPSNVPIDGGISSAGTVNNASPQQIQLSFFPGDNLGNFVTTLPYIFGQEGISGIIVAPINTYQIAANTRAVNLVVGDVVGVIVEFLFEVLEGGVN